MYKTIWEPKQGWRRSCWRICFIKKLLFFVYIILLCYVYSSVLWILKFIDDSLVMGREKMTYHPMLLSTCHFTLLGRRTSLKLQIDFSIVIIVDNFYRTRVRSLGMLVTNWLTHWLLFSKLDWCDPSVWRCLLKTCWGCYCCWCWWRGSCWQQFAADLEAEVWS